MQTFVLAALLATILEYSDTIKGSNVRNLVFMAALCGFLAIATPVQAQETAPADSSYLSLGVGYYDFMDDDAQAADFRVEYRSGQELFWGIKPFVGVEANDDGSVWGGAGITRDFMLAQNIYLSPSFGAGLYAQGSSDKDLGSVVEFRSQLEGGYQFDNGHRVGVAVSHISNAGLGSDNPGTEVLNLYYHIPINQMFGSF